MGEIATKPLPGVGVMLALPYIAANPPFELGASRASFLMEKILSFDKLFAKGPSGVAVNAQAPMGLTTVVGLAGFTVAGTSLFPSAITPAQSPICNFTRIFNAIAAALV